MEEDNFFGKTTPQEPSPHRMTAAFIDNKQTGVKIMDWEVSAAGYVAVWAQENTRVDLGCDAAKRNLCDDRASNSCSLLRRLGIRDR
ncbi:DUF3604 domain-containing protein [Rhizobium sp. RCAM05350]|nr:DUF3604 domain-containing protein [Rhizobium sp. RCAM05350]